MVTFFDSRVHLQVSAAPKSREAGCVTQLCASREHGSQDRHPHLGQFFAPGAFGQRWGAEVGPHRAAAGSAHVAPLSQRGLRCMCKFLQILQARLLVRGNESVNREL